MRPVDSTAAGAAAGGSAGGSAVGRAHAAAAVGGTGAVAATGGGGNGNGDGHSLRGHCQLLLQVSDAVAATALNIGGCLCLCVHAFLVLLRRLCEVAGESTTMWPIVGAVNAYYALCSRVLISARRTGMHASWGAWQQVLQALSFLHSVRADGDGVTCWRHAALSLSRPQ